MSSAAWQCPVCGGREWQPLYDVPAGGTEGGVNPDAFRPSSENFGTTAGIAVRCKQCGHGSLLEPPSAEAMTSAYADAADPVSIREEAGQVETGRRAMRQLEKHVSPGRVLDVGCWTGSLLVAARERGWTVEGIEPSAWASQRARDRGLDVRTAELDALGQDTQKYRAVTFCDVLEHLVSPGDALDCARDAIEPGGGIFITVPDAGSALARVMGRRWWSVLPMHVQYFTRATLTSLLDRHGFEVRSMESHAKVFTARYYAERLSAFAGGPGRVVEAFLKRSGLAERPVAPDFRDRAAAVAVRR